MELKDNQKKNVKPLLYIQQVLDETIFSRIIQQVLDETIFSRIMEVRKAKKYEKLPL